MRLYIICSWPRAWMKRLRICKWVCRRILNESNVRGMKNREQNCSVACNLMQDVEAFICPRCQDSQGGILEG